MPDNTDQLIFGLPDQWRLFREHHPEFLTRLPNLTNAIETAFLRDLMTPEGWDKFYFALGRVCVEDFWELLLLAGNGYGIGALKLLRALYERAVTLNYLLDHPNEIDNFIDYDCVAKDKLGKAIKNTGYVVAGLTAEVLEENKKAFDGVKTRFMVSDCKICGTERLNHSWNTLDFVSMANKTPLGRLLVPAYYVPMYHTHSTATAIFSRLTPTANGFNPDPQPGEATRALRYAHEIILYVLKVQSRHFKINALTIALDRAVQDFCQIWQKANDDSLLCAEFS